MKTTLSLPFEEQLYLLKTTFLGELAQAINGTPISAPLIVQSETGLNDDLNGVERPVRFGIKDMNNAEAVVVHSLAKWKRWRLGELKAPVGKGIIADMRALRIDEELDHLHSIYVDQWDWEQVISKEQRTIAHLKLVIEKIYAAVLSTAEQISAPLSLPPSLHFVHTEELLRQFPTLSPKEREQAITAKYRSVCILGIGGKLSDGTRHDGRAADYDDWSTPSELGLGLNADLLLWHEGLQEAIEISSMGIRVDAKAMRLQLEELNCVERSELPFHQAVLKEEIPFTIGGGIGQSRLALVLLQKKHIGEVQVSIWPQTMRESYAKQGIFFL